jgi:hypothetical protein
MRTTPDAERCLHITVASPSAATASRGPVAFTLGEDNAWGNVQVDGFQLRSLPSFPAVPAEAGGVLLATPR